MIEISQTIIKACYYSALWPKTTLQYSQDGLILKIQKFLCIVNLSLAS